MYLDKHFIVPEKIMEDGLIKFEIFIQVYKTALGWNKILFKERKNTFVTERRKLI